MIALSGIASDWRGFSDNSGPSVIRARSPASVPTHPADAALVRTSDEIETALTAGFTNAVLLHADADAIERSRWFARSVRLPTQFHYLSDGDILGLRPKERRFRTLYRRGSLHNSFLVTERCNHYCLMCSQPPKDIDDRWILKEIKTALPLVHPETASFAFTGGEPLLDWRDFVGVVDDCRNLLPNTSVHVLSNGRAFANTDVVNAWADIRHPSLSVGIPIYSIIVLDAVG